MRNASLWLELYVIGYQEDDCKDFVVVSVFDESSPLCVCVCICIENSND